MANAKAPVEKAKTAPAVPTSSAAIFRNLAEVVANTTLDRTALVRRMLDPRRDLNVECGYISDPEASDYDDMYKQEGVARRVVHVVPEECWQVNPEVCETEDPEETTFERAWKDLEEKHHLYSVMAKADALSGLGRFGIVLFGLRDGGKLEQQAKAGAGRELLYTRIFDESVVTIAESELDEQNPRYGQPVYYNVRFVGMTAGATNTVTRKVHHSRVVHIADNCRMSAVLGESRMRPVFNRLQDLRKLLGGSAEMFWQGAFPGLSFQVDPRLLESGAAEIDNDALKEQLQDYVNGLQRWLSVVGVDVKSLAPAVADPASHIAEQLRAIAISIGVPYRIFIGTEEGRLAGGEDAVAWAKRVRYRQENHVTSIIVQPFVERLIEVGVLPPPKTGKVKVIWPDTLTPSEKDEAEVSKMRTEAIKAYVQGDGHLIVPEDAFLVDVLGIDPDKAEEWLKTIEDAERDEEERHAAEAAKAAAQGLPQPPGQQQPGQQGQPPQPGQQQPATPATGGV
jgi:hypothetical protein